MPGRGDGGVQVLDLVEKLLKILIVTIPKRQDLNTANNVRTVLNIKQFLGCFTEWRQENRNV